MIDTGLVAVVARLAVSCTPNPVGKKASILGCVATVVLVASLVTDAAELGTALAAPLCTMELSE